MVKVIFGTSLCYNRKEKKKKKLDNARGARQRNNR